MRACEMMAVFTSAWVLAGQPGFNQRSLVLRSPGLGSFLKKICEAELKWSTSGLWTVRVFETRKKRVRQSEGGQRGEPGPSGREELCVMSEFACLSYFEMWPNSTPSVKLVPCARAARILSAGWERDNKQILDKLRFRHLDDFYSTLYYFKFVCKLIRIEWLS